MFLVTPLILTDSIANLRKTTFESVLREELRRECWDLLVEGLVRKDARIDKDTVKIHIAKVKNEKWSGHVRVTVVLIGEVPPDAAVPDAGGRFEKQHTIVFDPDAEGTEENPKAYHFIDTADWYEEEPEPIPSAKEESELTELLNRTAEKLEASVLEPDNPANVRTFMGIVERKSKLPHSEHMRSFLADIRRRLELLLRQKGADD